MPMISFSNLVFRNPNLNPYLTTFTRQKHSLPIPFTTFLHHLKSPPNLLQTKKLHALLLIHGFFHPSSPHTPLCSHLVNAYVNFGSHHYAFLFFSQLPHKSNLAWNAILRALIGSNNFTLSIQFYHSMLRHGFAPDNYTYPLVLKACSSLQAIEIGRWVYHNILINEEKANLFVQCALIDMFVKCESLEDARKVFDEMNVRDLATWTALICGNVWNGEWDEAVLLFRKMRLEGLKADSVIVASVLPVCGRLMEGLKLGMAMHGCALRSGFDSDLYVSNAIIDMYCKCGYPDEACLVFSYMVFRDIVSWSTLIAGYSQNGMYKESFELYVRMVNMGLTTNEIVVSTVLPALGKLKLFKQGKEMHNFVLKQGLLTDVVVGSALVDMYANCGSIKEAESIFRNMLDMDIMVWNSLIAGYNLVGDFQSAFFTFREIWVAEHRPNHITLVSVLPICTQIGALRQGKEIHCYATRSGLGLNISVGNSLIDMYSKCGFLELGVKVFNQMMVKNTITYNTMISACGAHGLGEKGLKFYEQMNEAGMKPNKVTFISLLSACSHAGLVDRGWLLYNSMVNDYGIKPDMEHYSCMVDLIGRTGDLDGAYKFITTMPVTPDANVLGSLLGACRLHNKVELADQLTAEHIFQLNTEDSGHYVLLSNLYASGKRWEDMSKVRSLIKDKGLEKKPGSSWIQVGHSIFVFHATSIFYPELAKIEETLDSLFLVMKNEDYILANLGFCSHVNDPILT
ncbi:putative tetratricopeptide-like helical domain-containing protein [Medicago truncatula]|uniref:Pentatricopeptide (PPR) repeat protein, putative n=1 Tax=Medicago truncatula TaxID=3880 RepID=A0A072VNF8_MEDTR|nr:putative pentatricopeptide repeat-containing protein At3g01580 [Medicago truncatula]KEH43176.1 pentatricopeptide (PPR) repeat protein, putative [Medicago truncatula]RHN80955.1 putative tetratricopeptide-like helical domain-containing protein [Medicago truncatula]